MYTLEHEALVLHIVNKFKPKHVSYKKWNIDKEDYLQVGRIGLLKALKKFDPSKNIKFTTFAWVCIFRTLITFHNKETKYAKNHYNNIDIDTYTSK